MIGYNSNQLTGHAIIEQNRTPDITKEMTQTLEILPHRLPRQNERLEGTFEIK